MSVFRTWIGKGGVYAAMSAFALSPTILLAFAAAGDGSGDSVLSGSFERFTPAGVDKALAEHFDLAALRDAADFNFTPAGKAEDDRSVTIVVRAAGGTSAKFVQSTQRTRAALAASKFDKKPVELGMTSYDLGAAKGIQSFAPTTAVEKRKTDEPRLIGGNAADGFRLDDKQREKLAAGLGESRTSSGMPRPTSGLADTPTATDLEGRMKVVKGVAVTAGVRTDKEELHTPRLTDDVRDNQAVYVGTLITF